MMSLPGTLGELNYLMSICPVSFYIGAVRVERFEFMGSSEHVRAYMKGGKAIEVNLNADEINMVIDRRRIERDAETFGDVS